MMQAARLDQRHHVFEAVFGERSGCIVVSSATAAGFPLSTTPEIFFSKQKKPGGVG